MDTLCPECKHKVEMHSHEDEFFYGGCAECECKHDPANIYRLLLSERDTALDEARNVIEPFANAYTNESKRVHIGEGEDVADLIKHLDTLDFHFAAEWIKEHAASPARA